MGMACLSAIFSRTSKGLFVIIRNISKAMICINYNLFIQAALVNKFCLLRMLCYLPRCISLPCWLSVWGEKSERRLDIILCCLHATAVNVLVKYVLLRDRVHFAVWLETWILPFW